MTEMRREIRWEPRKGRMNVRFLLHGDLGAVQFLWNIKTSGEREAKHGLWDVAEVPSGYDLGFHSCRPRQWQGEGNRMDCEFLPQGFCYYDGSGLQAEDVAKRFIVEGEDAVWEVLADRYQTWLVDDE